jgi:hypothetical protein
MQGSRSHDAAREFDRFDCQTCHTVIEQPARPPRDETPSR